MHSFSSPVFPQTIGLGKTSWVKENIEIVCYVLINYFNITPGRPVGRPGGRKKQEAKDLQLLWERPDSGR